MSKFKNRVEAGVIWLARFKIFAKLFAWMQADPGRNQRIFLFCVNIFNTLIFLTAAISPWIYVTWTLLVPIALFQLSPIAALINLIKLVRDREIGVGGFIITVFFMMIHYICLFACFYMIFGVIENTDGQIISGLWSNFYFSTVTFTTLGYGNMVPANTAGEVIAAFEAIVGFAAFAFLIGIASAFAIGKRNVKND